LEMGTERGLKIADRIACSGWFAQGHSFYG